MTTNLAEIREGLHDMEQACRQGRLLAKQLLTFAKGGAPVKQLTDIKRLVEESARLALSGSKAKTVFSWPRHLWLTEVDPGQMHQVFTNLLINADQAMPAGGQIDIGAENYLIEAGSALPLPPGRYLLIRVSDQGVGIPPEHLDKIFDPYFTTKQKGSGLGLTMVYSIVTQHGGLITCTSQLGRGTTFSIYLPAQEREVQTAGDQGQTLFKGQGRILVLEDEAAIQAVMAKMLQKLGYEAEFAQTGQEVLQLYAQERGNHGFAAVILDLTIPGGMGGLETCQKLREMDPQVKAIVSSGYADDPVLADYRSFGFSGVIAKPYRIVDLSRVLHEVLS
jgi:CheY-like chemotaxis protein